MSRSAASLLLMVLSVSLAACTPTSTDAPDDVVADTPPAAAEPAPEAPGALEEGCDADAVQSLVGQQADDSLVEQARTDAGAEIARVLKPGQVVTMEYRADRLNIDVDESGTITALRCG
ncbi:I78 family peptidase inhibitor [Luteimonas suaedae]|uniref:I78 family peptidase inhibitor n=1 Tax=Luteimonas suaedae TaxID=2605430 RepID=UPI002106BB6D|nr:I78 family peptidase inhibitor [Luteimonas suaedae]